MPRKPRLHVPGAFYHITLRGNHRQDIFLSPSDRDLFDTDFALSAFHQERSAAIAAYERFVNQEIGKISSSPLLEVNSTEPRILGSDEFAGRLLGDSWAEISEVASRLGR